LLRAKRNLSGFDHEYIVFLAQRQKYSKLFVADGGIEERTSLLKEAMTVSYFVLYNFQVPKKM
jgi:hypothetical protein